MDARTSESSATEPARVAQSARLLFSFIRWALVAVVSLLVLLLVLLVIGWKTGAVFGKQDETITSTSIGASFSDIAELATEEYVFSNVGQWDEGGYTVLGLEVPFTSSSFLITYDGEVKAGIADYSQIVVDIRDEAQKISVNMPPVVVLSTSIDPGSVKQYDQSFNPVNQLQVADIAKFLEAEEKRAERKAVDNGLLDRASERARDLIDAHIATMIDGSSISEYEIVFADEEQVTNK